MCCLFGVYDYTGGLTAAQKRRLVSALATASAARGTDATGVAYNSDGHLAVYKRPWPAHLMRFRLPENVRCIIGHTRMTTQGDEKKNCNNHPFVGTSGMPFALAHNGIIYNDKELRQERKLPDTNIETDSYIAVQLLEQQEKLNFSTIRTAAEALEGTLTLTILDGRDNLYIIKGNNPLTLYHFPRLGLYTYASTEAILKKGLKKGFPHADRPVEVVMKEGDILRIDRHGRYTVEQFSTHNLWEANFRYCRLTVSTYSGEREYIDDLKSIAPAYGYDPRDIDAFLHYGMCPEEIEELMCGGEV